MLLVRLIRFSVSNVWQQVSRKNINLETSTTVFFFIEDSAFIYQDVYKNDKQCQPLHLFRHVLKADNFFGIPFAYLENKVFPRTRRQEKTPETD